MVKLMGEGGSQPASVKEQLQLYRLGQSKLPSYGLYTREPHDVEFGARTRNGISIRRDHYSYQAAVSAADLQSRRATRGAARTLAVGRSLLLAYFAPYYGLQDGVDDYPEPGDPRWATYDTEMLTLVGGKLVANITRATDGPLPAEESLEIQGHGTPWRGSGQRLVEDQRFVPDGGDPPTGVRLTVEDADGIPGFDERESPIVYGYISAVECRAIATVLRNLHRLPVMHRDHP